MKRQAIQKLGTRIGFLGGGQLARMLALAAHPLGLVPKALVSSQTDCACSVLDSFQVGDLSSKADILDFLKSLDVLTFESEFINADLIEEAAKESSCFIFPKVSLMKILQNRVSQKKILDKYKIPTSQWIEISEVKELDHAWQKLGAFVLKASFGGYDGKGTFIAKNQAAMGQLSQQISGDSQKFIAEKFVSFKRELACIYVRSSDGSFCQLPLVETHQTQQRCDWVMGPITHPDLKKISAQIQKMMKSIDYVGALAVEFFDTGKKLVVNEMAPRVHNSGHYSQNALNFSQFDLHLLAGFGEKLPTSESLAKAFVMTNLVGETDRPFQIPSGLSGHLHWYSKNKNRSGRKMGHINYVGSNLKLLLAKALKERKKISK